MKKNLLPVLLSFFIAGAKLLRVPILLYFLSVGEYSNFVYYLFVFGLFVAFEQMISNIIINAFSNEKDLSKLPKVLKKQLNKTLFFFQFISTLLIVTNVNFLSGYSIYLILVFVCFLNISLWIYLKVIFFISALEVNGYTIQNRLFKFTAELLFLLISVILLSFSTNVLSVIASFTFANILIYLFSKKTLSNYKISIANEKNSLIDDRLVKNYWSQLFIQGATVLARSMPMLFIAYIGSAEQIAFYFVAAQLYQIGPLILFPVLTAQYPSLRLGGLSNNLVFIRVSIFTILIISISYLALFYNMSWILDIWTSGKLFLDYKLLVYLNILSLVAAIHIAFKYFTTAKDMSYSLIKCYSYSVLVSLLLASFIISKFSILDGVFVYSISFEIFAVIYILINLSQNKYSKIDPK